MNFFPLYIADLKYLVHLIKRALLLLGMYLLPLTLTSYKNPEPQFLPQAALPHQASTNVLLSLCAFPLLSNLNWNQSPFENKYQFVSPPVLLLVFSQTAAFAFFLCRIKNV